METFLVTYWVDPPQTVVHREDCADAQGGAFVQRVEADDAATLHARLVAEYERRLATEVQIRRCTCTGGRA
jgi:hypothetical protein